MIGHPNKQITRDYSFIIRHCVVESKINKKITDAVDFWHFKLFYSTKYESQDLKCVDMLTILSQRHSY